MKTLTNLNSIKDIPTLEGLGVLIEFEPQEEDMIPDFENEEDIKEVERKYNAGNMAAWFCAKVTVTYKGLTAEDYLGGCSYNSFKEFTEIDNDYYMDMINTCINEINRQVQSVNFGTQRKWNIRKAKNIINPYDLYIVNSKELQTL